MKLGIKELLLYNDLNELVQFRVRVQQLKRKFATRKNYPTSSYPKRGHKREGYYPKSKYEG